MIVIMLFFFIFVFEFAIWDPNFPFPNLLPQNAWIWYHLHEIEKLVSLDHTTGPYYKFIALRIGRLSKLIGEEYVEWQK